MAVLRDPVDRAHSNWMHLWADGLEPVSDVVWACELEERRIDDGWAPFRHDRHLGMYGRQLADLCEHFPRQQVLVLRYRSLVENPCTALNRVCRFLGVAEDVVTDIRSGNSQLFVNAGPRTTLIGSVVRAGVAAGQLVPPQVWRARSATDRRPASPARQPGAPRADPRAVHVRLTARLRTGEHQAETLVIRSGAPSGRAASK